MNLREEGCWDQHYEVELKNYQDNGDCGDVWFGKPLTRRIVDWLLRDIQNGHLKPSSASIDILDVGCGNAFLLCSLMKRSRDLLVDSTLDRLQLLGIDYSKNSIELSRMIIESESRLNQIHLQQCDFLDLQQVVKLNEGSKFDFIVDKGTFDAICLIGDGQDTCKQVKQKYSQSILALTKPGTTLILASCNHTEDELLNLFDIGVSGGGTIPCKLIDRIETPKISFGGKEGSQVCCLIIRFH